MKTKYQSGFTIIELMVVLVVAAILMMVGVPSYQNMVQNNRVASLANSLVSSLNVARSEAIKRTANVQVCISNNQTSCAGTNWADGWLVWVDLDSDSAVDTNEIILAHEALESATLTAVDQATNPVTTVTYTGSGFLNLAVGTTVTFALQPSNCSGAYRREIGLVPTGRPTMSAMSCI